MRVRSPSTTLTLTITVSPGSKSGMSLPAESFADLLFLELLDQVHGEFSVGQRQFGEARGPVGLVSGRASFYDTGAALSIAVGVERPIIGAFFARSR